jgi:hypothetical protein
VACAYKLLCGSNNLIFNPVAFLSKGRPLGVLIAQTRERNHDKGSDSSGGSPQHQSQNKAAGFRQRQRPLQPFRLWLGWTYLRIKAQGPWHKGACFYFLPFFGGAFYTKSARRPRQVPGQFPNRLEVIHKNVSDWFYK